MQASPTTTTAAAATATRPDQSGGEPHHSLAMCPPGRVDLLLPLPASGWFRLERSCFRGCDLHDTHLTPPTAVLRDRSLRVRYGEVGRFGELSREGVTGGVS